VNGGDTLIIPVPSASLDSHLWMVISDPSQSDRCLLVNLTSWRADKDQACVVNPGEHPFISKKSCVNYRDAKWCPTADLDALLASNRINKHDPLSPELLKRIRNSALDSRMTMEHAQILSDQGLVED